MSLQAMRQRMPLLAFILLAILCLALLGFACACLTDHPMKALDRALGGIPALPALIEIWPVFASAALALAYFASRRIGVAELSPASLQRFLL